MERTARARALGRWIKLARVQARTEGEEKGGRERERVRKYEGKMRGERMHRRTEHRIKGETTVM